MILMIDNYDSFTFNIVQYLGELGADVLVKRNNEISSCRCCNSYQALANECVIVAISISTAENCVLKPFKIWNRPQVFTGRITFIR